MTRHSSRPLASALARSALRCRRFWTGIRLRRIGRARLRAEKRTKVMLQQVDSLLLRQKELAQLEQSLLHRQREMADSQQFRQSSPLPTPSLSPEDSQRVKELLGLPSREQTPPPT